MADANENDGPYDPFAETMPPEEGQGQQSSNDAYAESRSRSRSPVRKSRSRSRSPRDWKRNERSDRSDRNRERSRDRDRDRRSGGSGQKRLYISNIPYELRWQDLKDLFREKVGEVTYVELYESADGKPCGSGIIEFKDKETALKAIESMHKYDIKGRKIVVREERESDRRRHARNQTQAMGSGGGGGGGGSSGGGGGGGGSMGDMGSLSMGGGMGGGGSMGGGSGGSMGNLGNMGGGGMGMMNMNTTNNSGISPQILQQLGIDGPVTSQVFIANLDYKVTIKKIRDIFKMAGNIVNAELKIDKEGKSRGMAIVQFENPLEAVQGISMFNGQILYERAMSVRMDKMAEQNQPTPQRLPSGLKTIGMGLGMNGAPVTGLNQLQAMMSQGGMGGSLSGMGNMGGGNMGGSNMGGNMGNMGGGGAMGGGMNSNAPGMGMNMSGGTGMGNMGGSGMGSGMGGMGNMGMGGNFGDGMMGGGGMGSGSNMGMSGMGSNNMGMGGGAGGMDSMGMRGMDSVGGMGMGSTGGSSSMSNMNMGNMGNLGGMGLMGMGGSGSSAVGQSALMRNSSSNRIIDVDNTTVFVRNLPFTYTWQNLKEKFRHIGDVKYAAIRMENNRSKGCGVVRFTSQDEARRAINMMNGARIEGREIEVRMDSR